MSHGLFWTFSRFWTFSVGIFPFSDFYPWTFSTGVFHRDFTTFGLFPSDFPIGLFSIFRLFPSGVLEYSRRFCGIPSGAGHMHGPCAHPCAWIHPFEAFRLAPDRSEWISAESDQSENSQNFLEDIPPLKLVIQVKSSINKI